MVLLLSLQGASCGEAEVTMDSEVIHYGPKPMASEFPVEVWEPYPGVTLCGGSPHAEAVVFGRRFRNDEHGRVWRRTLHGPLGETGVAE